jgi:hypothetical protein
LAPAIEPITSRPRDLIVAQEPPVRIVERRAREQLEIGLAVEADLLEEVVEAVPVQRQAHVLEHVRVPVLGGEAAEPEHTLL